MRFLLCLSVLCSAFWACAHDLNIKIAAIVNDRVISTQDVINHQKVMKILSGNKKITEKESLEDIITKSAYTEYAKKLEINTPQEKIDAAINSLKSSGIEIDLSQEIFASEIESELVVAQILEEILYPKVYLNKDDIEDCKNNLLKKQDSVRLKQILNSEDDIDLGWVDQESLVDNLRSEINKLSVGQTTAEIDQKKFKLIDRASSVLLSAEFRLKESDGSVSVIKLADADNQSRKKLEQCKIGEKVLIKTKNRVIDAEVLESNFFKIIEQISMQIKFEKEQKSFTDELIKNTAITRKI